jgi:hypothetical protein
MIKISDTEGKPAADPAAPWRVPAVRTVELTAARFADDDVLSAMWVAVVDGARRSSNTKPAYLRRPGQTEPHRVVASHDLARWVEVGCRALAEDDDRPYATVLLGCRECGTTEVLHADGCRICADSVPQLAGYKPGGRVPPRVGYALFRAGTDERAVLGLFPNVEHATAWAESLGDVGALDVRPVR